MSLQDILVQHASSHVTSAVGLLLLAQIVSRIAGSPFYIPRLALAHVHQDLQEYSRRV